MPASGSPVWKITLSRKLGVVPTGGITAYIIAVLTPIWQGIPETAGQVRNRICAVLDYAHAKG